MNERGTVTTTPYIESINRFRESLRDALNVADDPYKAPELTVHASRRVVEAAWEMQIEYAALTRHA